MYVDTTLSNSKVRIVCVFDTCVQCIRIMCVHMYTYIRMCVICVCTHVYVCVHVGGCVYICICLWCVTYGVCSQD